MTYKNISEKIIDKSEVVKDDNGFYSIDLMPIIGMSIGSDEDTKAKATKDITSKLEKELEAGNLTLSEDFISKL